MNPLTVCFHNVKTNRTVTRFLDMCCTSGEDCGLASTIYNEIDSNPTCRQPYCVFFFFFHILVKSFEDNDSFIESDLEEPNIGKHNKKS